MPWRWHERGRRLETPTAGQKTTTTTKKRYSRKRFTPRPLLLPSSTQSLCYIELAPAAAPFLPLPLSPGSARVSSAKPFISAQQPCTKKRRATQHRS